MLAIALGCALLVAATVAQAERRVALVIGNDTYAHLPDLKNAGKDARDMAAKLKTLGFEVIARYNASERDMVRAIRRFSSRLSAGGTGLVFYAGHGVQADGTNYLIPADAAVEVEDDLESEAVDANRILRAMKNAGNPLNIIILDACRDNPLPKRTRSAARGLAITAVPSGAKGTAILYAAGPGETAQDGPEGGNGVFTGALLRHMDQPGLTLEQVFKATSREVLRQTNNRQRPWQLVSLQGDFVFKSARATSVATVSHQPATPQAGDPSIAIYSAIQNSADPADFEAFLRDHPDSPMAPYARRKLKKLGKRVAAVSPPQKPEIELVPVEAAYVTTRNANVRAEPSVSAAKVTTLQRGAEVYVPGRTKDGDWLRVERDGKALGYVYKTLLEDKAALEEAQRKAAQEQEKLEVTKLRVEADRNRLEEERRKLAAATPPPRPTEAPVTECDNLAANPADPQAVTPGRKLAQITDAGAAITSCRDAVARYSDTPRFKYQLGRALVRSGSYVKAIKWFREVAIQNYSAAENNMGIMYARGKGVTKDDVEAVRWYRKAAAQDNASAQVNLGFMYEVGRGVPKDDVEAVRWYRKAAAQGHPNARKKLDRLGK